MFLHEQAMMFPILSSYLQDENNCEVKEYNPPHLTSSFIITQCDALPHSNWYLLPTYCTQTYMKYDGMGSVSEKCNWHILV